MERHENILIPTNEQSVDFYGDEITTALVTVENGTQVYVPLRPICEYLGLSWSGQYERIHRNFVLTQKVKLIRLNSFRKKRGNPTLLCLPLELFHGWLFGIAANRVKPQLIPKLIRYQQQCFFVLWKTFQSAGSCLNIDNEGAKTNIFNMQLFSYHQIKESVQAQLLRAEQASLPATLTLQQWLSTLKYFHGRCAYCSDKPGIVIEHFIPLSAGGGTTVGNCVPSCYSCNSKKRDETIESISLIPRNALERVKKQLVVLETFSQSAAIMATAN